MASKTRKGRRSTSRSRSASTSRRRGALRKDGKLTWIGFLKKYMKDYDVSYGEAMHAARGPWEAYKEENEMD